MAETPYYDRSDFFKELVERLEKEEEERRAAPANTPVDPDNTGGSKSRPLDPKIVEAMKRADQARSQGQGLSLVKSVLDFVRDGGDPSLVRGLITRRDLEDLGVLTSRAESRRKEREERYKRNNEKRAAAQERFQAQRKKLKERNLQRSKEAAERNERSPDFVGPRQPREAPTNASAGSAGPAGAGMTFEDVLDMVTDFGPIPSDDPIVRDRPTGKGFDDLMSIADAMKKRNEEFAAESKRRSATRDEQIALDLAERKKEIDRDYLLGLEHNEYLAGEGPGSYLYGVRNSPEFKAYEEEMRRFQDQIRGGHYSDKYVEDSLGNVAPGGFDRAEAAMNRERPRPPAPPPPMSFNEFKKDRDPTFRDDNNDGIDDRIAVLEQQKARMKKEEKLRKLEEDNRKLQRDRARQEMLKGQQSPTMSPGMGPM